MEMRKAYNSKNLRIKMAELPIHPEIKVLAFKDIYKTDQWRKTVTLQEAFGRKEIACYLWRKKGDEWKRKQKLTFKSKEEWEKVKQAVEDLLKEL